MRSVGRNDSCPCGSGSKFKKCCGPALDGISWPETPEALMRSRYTGFVTGAVEHLWRTSHPGNEQLQGIDFERFKQETLNYCRQVEFSGLTIHQTWPEDEQGVAKVKFTAAYTLNGKPDTMTELSSFVKHNGNWVYLKGDEE